MKLIMRTRCSDHSAAGRSRSRVIAPVALAAVLVGVTGSSAAAAEDRGRGPVHREPISERVVADPDPMALDVCGVEVRRETRVKGHFVAYGNNTTRTHLVTKDVWTDPDSGRVLFASHSAETYFESPVSETVDEDARTVTLVYDLTITGLPVLGRSPGRGVLARDAGRLSTVVTVVRDLDTGGQISFDERIVDVRGPHPFLDLSPEERDAIFCSQLR